MTVTEEEINRWCGIVAQAVFEEQREYASARMLVQEYVQNSDYTFVPTKTRAAYKAMQDTSIGEEAADSFLLGDKANFMQWLTFVVHEELTSRAMSIWDDLWEEHYN